MGFIICSTTLFVCKYRRRTLNPDVSSYLRRILPQLAQNIPGVKIETIGFDQDHLHMVMGIPPKFSIAAVMGRMKNQSSSVMRENFKFLEKVYWKENIVWSPGYFVGSVSRMRKLSDAMLNTRYARIQVNFE
ncbi:MAG: IS200/IS605 family transposase [Bdellovibrionales bacterium]|nr:IS200/IS605 family transposase [Bdellovibrionales bacterium]